MSTTNSAIARLVGKKPTLVETLAAKADQLDATHEAKKTAAASLAAAAARAQAEADEAARHGQAIDQARFILNEAGVNL